MLEVSPESIEMSSASVEGTPISRDGQSYPCNYNPWLAPHLHFFQTLTFRSCLFKSIIKRMSSSSSQSSSLNSSITGYRSKKLTSSSSVQTSISIFLATMTEALCGRGASTGKIGGLLALLLLALAQKDAITTIKAPTPQYIQELHCDKDSSKL